MAHIIGKTSATEHCKVMTHMRPVTLDHLVHLVRYIRISPFPRFFFIIMAISLVTSITPLETVFAQNTVTDLASLDGITHYGMAIEEVTRKLEKKGSVLEVVYSKNLSDDNMDDFVKLLFDEMLRLIEAWFYEQKNPENGIRIVVSNCKFCKIGYCKRKGIREIRIVSYKNGNEFRHATVTHRKLLEKEKTPAIARGLVSAVLGL